MRCWLNSTASAGNVVWSCGNPPDESYVLNGYNEYDDEAGFLTNFTQSERNAMKTVTQKSLLDGYEYSQGSTNTINSNYHGYCSVISLIVGNYDTAFSETVTFTSDTETESGYDYIYIYDAEDNQIGKYSGTQLAGATVNVPGNTVKIKITSDGSVTRYGFKTESIVVNK